MDGFAKQLANLQQAASRAGRSNDGGRGRGGSDSGGRGREGRGYQDNRHERSYQDNRRDRQYTDHHNNPRKRGRYDNNDNRNSNGGGRYRNDYNGGGSSPYRGGGRGRGWNEDSRWNNNRHQQNNNDRDERRGNKDTNSNVPMAELVSKVVEKYKAAQEADATNESKIDTSISVKKQKQRHIALLFLTIDDLPHEHIWKEWMNSASDSYNLIGDDNKKDGGEVGKNDDEVDSTPTKSDNDVNVKSMASTNDDNVMVSVLCHAKYPERIKSPWLRQRHLLQKKQHNSNSAEDSGSNLQSCNVANNKNSPNFHSRRPEWGSIEITRAMIDLLEEGLRIGQRSEENDGDYQSSYHRYLSTPCHCSSASSTQEDTTDESKDTKQSSIQIDTDFPRVDRFIFVSESCLPVATLKELELALFGPRHTQTVATSDGDIQQDEIAKPPAKNVEALYNKSWVNARSTPNNGYARQLQWDAIRQTDIPHNLVWKADQWLVLTRQHGEAVASIPNKYLEDGQLWSTLRKVRASDEIYFPTALSILGILHRPAGVSEVDDRSKESSGGDGIRKRRITYCDWSMGAKNPASLTCLEWKDVVKKARGEGCLLARKFVPASSLAVRGGGRKKSAEDNDDNDGLVSITTWKSAVIN